MLLSSVGVLLLSFSAWFSRYWLLCFVGLFLVVVVLDIVIRRGIIGRKTAHVQIVRVGDLAQDVAKNYSLIPSGMATNAKREWTGYPARNKGLPVEVLLLDEGSKVISLNYNGPVTEGFMKADDIGTIVYGGGTLFSFVRDQ